MKRKKTDRNNFNSTHELNRITRFIEKRVEDAHAKGVVVGISGGIDSAVVASLCVRAVGRKKVFGLMMFEDVKTNQDFQDARKIIARLRIRSYRISITPIVNSFSRSIRPLKLSKHAIGNIKARTRMVLLYAFANEYGLLVAGTGDRSEEEIGYFTKYGDGGVDFQPISHLFKTQVKTVAQKLGIPPEIVSKPSSPQLWSGHKASDEIPLDYPVLDIVLSLLYDRRKEPAEVARKLKIDLKAVKDVLSMHDKSRHKRMIPPELQAKSL
jgi:NAD+ synthase